MYNFKNTKNIWPVIAFYFLLFLFISTRLSAQNVSWESLPKILENIKPPSFLSAEYNALDYGAKNDLSFNSQPAINNAILDCSKKGGGKVIIPKGIYLVNGPIVMKSNVNLFLEEGVEIKFGTNPEDYLPMVMTRWEGMECYNYSSLVYAFGEKNFAITGKGILDGQASNDNWWKWSGSTRYGWVQNTPSQRDSNSRPLLMKMNNEQVPVEKRIFGKDQYLRPNFVQFYKCENILLDGITVKNSPMWILHPVLCKNVIIQNVSTISYGPNTDGCDPESCKDVLIKNCYFQNGDDCIAIKSGRNNDGRRINIPSENIIIQGCKMKDGHGGITVGSEISGGCRNVFAEDCEMDSPNLDKAFRFKSNTVRGGNLENMFFRNIKIGQVKEAVLHIDWKYEPREGKGEHLPILKNVFIDNIQSGKSERALYIVGLENSPIQSVTISNSNFAGTSKENLLEHILVLKFSNVKINGNAAVSPVP